MYFLSNSYLYIFNWFSLHLREYSIELFNKNVLLIAPELNGNTHVALIPHLYINIFINTLLKSSCVFLVLQLQDGAIVNRSGTLEVHTYLVSFTYTSVRTIIAAAN